MSGKHGVVVAGDFKGEDDEGEGGAGRGSEHGAHGDERECSGRKMSAGEDAVQQHGKRPAQGGA